MKIKRLLPGPVLAGATVALVQLPLIFREESRGGEHLTAAYAVSALFTGGHLVNPTQPPFYVYLLTVPYAFYCAVLKIMGSVDEPALFLGRFIEDAGPFLLMGRFVSLLGSAVAGGLLYHILRAESRLAAIAGALVWAVSSLAVRAGTAVEEDQVSTALFLASHFLLLDPTRRPKETRNRLIAAGVLGGLSVATKHTLAPLGLMLAASAWIGGPRLSFGRGNLPAFMLGAVAAFLCAHLSPLGHFREFWSAALPELVVNVPHGTSMSPSGGILYYARVLMSEGMGLFLLFIFGSFHQGVRPARPHVRSWIVLTWSYIVFLSVMKTQATRYVLPVFPLIILIGVFELHVAIRFLQLRSVRLMRVFVGSVLLVVLAIPAFRHLGAVTRDRSRADNEAGLYSWIGRHMPKGSRLVVDLDALPYSDMRFEVMARSPLTADIRSALESESISPLFRDYQLGLIDCRFEWGFCAIEAVETFSPNYLLLAPHKRRVALWDWARRNAVSDFDYPAERPGYTAPTHKLFVMKE